MANFTNPIYKFEFADPILFRRVYDFKMPDSFANYHWTPLDSKETEITKYQTKNTLVQNITLTYFPQEDVLYSYYRVSMRGANTADVFKVAPYNIGNLLEIFGIM